MPLRRIRCRILSRVFFLRGLAGSCGVLTDQCQTLDESFPFLPTGWQADRIGDQFILGPGPQAGPPSQQMGNAD